MKTKIKLLSSDSTPIESAVISATSMLSKEPGGFGIERTGITNNNGKVSLDLFDGEWSINVISGIPPGQHVFINTVVIPADLPANRRMTIKAHTSCTVKGRVEISGANASTTRDILSRASQSGMAVIVMERLPDDKIEGVATFANLKEDGSFRCKLINTRDMILDIVVFIPGDTYSYRFNLNHQVSSGAKSATLRPVTVHKIDEAIVSMRGWIKTGTDTQLKVITAETRSNDDVILLAEAFSNKRGAFELYDLPEGEYTLKVYDMMGEDLYSPTIIATLDVQSGLTTVFRVKVSV